MKDIKELREELASVFFGLKDGTIDDKVAAEMNNSAGKMIKSCAVQLEYIHLSGRPAKIEFLDCE